MPKKKMLFLVTKATWGGAQKYVYDLATNLSKTEFDVIVAYGEHGKLAKDLAAAGIKLRELPSLRRDIAIFSDIKSLIETIKMLKELQPDVIHLNSSKAAALGALAARIAGVEKIIFTVHGWPFKESRNTFWRLLIFSVSWLTALLSHKVIVVSKIDWGIAARMPGLRKKTFIVSLGIRGISVLPPSQGLLAMFRGHPPPLHGSTLRLVSIGELTANKGIIHAIRAVAELKQRGIDSVYVVAGEGEERKNLESTARREGVSDRIYFPGYIEHASQYLAGFDVLVLPSLKEGTPYVLLEAAQIGIPIVATNVIDADLVARFGSARLVQPSDSLAIADAVTDLSRRSPHVQTTNPFPLADMVGTMEYIYLND